MNGMSIAIALELQVNGDSLSGRLTGEGGITREFTGWLGLIAAIDALVFNPSGEPTASRPSS
jgi:hypothetical protein